MESTVEKLEAMFVKSEADLEYMEKRLKLDFINNTTESRSGSEVNPVVMLEKLKAIKAKHSSLSSRVKEILAAQKLSMESISSNVTRTLDLIQHFQETTEVEIESLSGSETEAAAALRSASSRIKAETPEASQQKLQDVT